MWHNHQFICSHLFIFYMAWNTVIDDLWPMYDIEAFIRCTSNKAGPNILCTVFIFFKCLCYYKIIGDSILIGLEEEKRACSWQQQQCIQSPCFAALIRHSIVPSGSGLRHCVSVLETSLQTPWFESRLYHNRPWLGVPSCGAQLAQRCPGLAG